MTPAHGTGFDIATKGVANAEAIRNLLTWPAGLVVRAAFRSSDYPLIVWRGNDIATRASSRREQNFWIVRAHCRLLAIPPAWRERTSWLQQAI